MRGHCVSVLAFSMCMLAVPASALDVSVDAGDVGLDASVSVGSDGVSVDVDADVGGAGSVDAGVSAGPGGTSVDVDADVGGTGVGASVGGGGTSVDANSDDAEVSGTSSTGETEVGGTVEGPSTAGSAATPGTVDASTAPQGGTVGRSTSAKAVTKPVKAVKSARHAITLPPILRPQGGERVPRNAFGYPLPPLAALKTKPGVSPALVRTCRSAITSAARPLGAIRVEVASAGMSRTLGKQVSAPLSVRIRYARRGGIETRQANVSCRVNANGQVIAVR